MIGWVLVYLNERQLLLPKQNQEEQDPSTSYSEPRQQHLFLALKGAMARTQKQKLCTELPMLSWKKIYCELSKALQSMNTYTQYFNNFIKCIFFSQKGTL